MAQVQQAAAVPSLDVLGEKSLALVLRYFSHAFQCGDLNQLHAGTLHAVSNDKSVGSDYKGQLVGSFCKYKQNCLEIKLILVIILHAS